VREGFENRGTLLKQAVRHLDLALQNVYRTGIDRIAARLLWAGIPSRPQDEIMVYELIGIAGSSNDPECVIAQWHEEMLKCGWPRVASTA